MSITPLERVERALRHECVDRVPFTVYDAMLPRSRVERDLRNRGACVMAYQDVLKAYRPDVRTTQYTYREGGVLLMRIEHETPCGTLTEILEPAGFTNWRHKPLFSSPEDYRRLAFFIDNECYEPDYAPYLTRQEMMGGDALLRVQIGLEPLQQLISGGIMNTEVFCTEWLERQDEVIALYEACARAARRRYRLLAESPCWSFNYGGNVTVEIIGPHVFEQYYMPHYEEAAAILHAHGKIIGCHLDANNRLIAPLVARTPLDYIEAFTPAPDTDMTLAEAFAAWPDKALWINFPSSVHVLPAADIARTTHALLDAAQGRLGFLIGITENVPDDRWQESFSTIMDVIEQRR